MSQTPDDEWPLKPGDEASELDRHVMKIALDPHQAGWSDDAERVSSAAAYLRRTWRQPVGDQLHDAYDALETIRDNAQAVLDAIERAYPNELALRRRDG
ncbi:hypothetical protein [Amycolatopsis cihanbeyliensis]|uniref:Uncharacterized protein n=1 Tax=Amycolatopsis cihanbeyliensis TaxID=1128664 RepID=A0A542DNY1_AMYCI|nr:hypothetical protein [Amycolatopsis cihanbeyliensis]TQJ04684.1 hypothetical protein FB471_4490 [Amycolatopsis cihanbeyliensis]